MAYRSLYMQWLYACLIYKNDEITCTENYFRTPKPDAIQLM